MIKHPLQLGDVKNAVPERFYLNMPVLKKKPIENDKGSTFTMD
jgi:hypothetical protein